MNMNKIDNIYSILVSAALFALLYVALASGETSPRYILDAITFSPIGLLVIIILLPSPYFLSRALTRDRNVIRILLLAVAIMVCVPVVWTFFVSILVGVAFIGG